MNIEVEYIADEPTLIHGREWHWRKFGPLRHLWIILGTILILVGAILIPTPLRAIPYAMIILGIYCLVRKRLLLTGFLRSIRTSSFLNKRIRWRFTDSNIVQESELGNSEFNWSAIQESISTPEGFLLYLKKNQYFWIPEIGFTCPGGAEELRGFLSKMKTNRAFV